MQDEYKELPNALYPDSLVHTLIVCCIIVSLPFQLSPHTDTPTHTHVHVHVHTHSYIWTHTHTCIFSLNHLRVSHGHCVLCTSLKHSCTQPQHNDPNQETSHKQKATIQSRVPSPLHLAVTFVALSSLVPGAQQVLSKYLLETESRRGQQHGVVSKVVGAPRRKGRLPGALVELREHLAKPLGSVTSQAGVHGTLKGSPPMGSISPGQTQGDGER